MSDEQGRIWKILALAWEDCSTVWTRDWNRPPLVAWRRDGSRWMIVVITQMRRVHPQVVITIYCWAGGVAVGLMVYKSEDIRLKSRSCLLDILTRVFCGFPQSSQTSVTILL
jgi:hypothetical protein